MPHPNRGIIHELPAVSGQISSNDSVRILHVDDSPDFGELVREVLESEMDNFEVASETNPTVVVDQLPAHVDDFDCIVSDFQMPEMDGLQLLEAVRERAPNFPFILVTGRGSEDIASNAISAGVTDYLQKKGGLEQFTVLANRVENAVARYRAESRVRRMLQALERAREGIGILDDDGRFQYVNHAYSEIVGYRQEELLGEHWELLYADGAEAEMRAEILPALSQSGRWEGYTNYVRKDGGSVVVDHGLSYTDDGDLVCLIRPNS